MIRIIFLLLFLLGCGGGGVGEESSSTEAGDSTDGNISCSNAQEITIVTNGELPEFGEGVVPLISESFIDPETQEQKESVTIVGCAISVSGDTTSDSNNQTQTETNTEST